MKRKVLAYKELPMKVDVLMRRMKLGLSCFTSLLLGSVACVSVLLAGPHAQGATNLLFAGDLTVNEGTNVEWTVTRQPTGFIEEISVVSTSTIVVLGSTNLTYASSGHSNATLVIDGISPGIVGVEFSSTNGLTTTWTNEITVNNVAPTIDSFTIPASGFVNDQITFSATASDPGTNSLTYTWNFGDGQTSNNLPSGTVIHEYAAGSTYSVQLTVEDGNGGSATENGAISINSLVFLGSPSVDEGADVTWTVIRDPSAIDETISLVSTSTAVTIPGGNDMFYRAGQDETSTVIRGVSPGVVGILFLSGTGTNTWTREITVNNVAPTIDSFTIPASGFVNDQLTFSATASDPGINPLTYTWDFGDLETSNNLPSGTVIHHYGAVGTYVVQLTVEDGNGGSDSANGTISITERHLSLSYQAGGNSIDEGTTEIWTVSREGSTDAQLIVSLSSTNSSAAQVSPSVTIQAGAAEANFDVLGIDGPGVSDIKAEATGYISDTNAVTVNNVNPRIISTDFPEEGLVNDTLTFSVVAEDVLPDYPLTYTWAFGDGTPVVVGAATENHQYTLAGSYTLTLTVEDDDGGSTVTNAEVYIGNCLGAKRNYQDYALEQGYANLDDDGAIEYNAGFEPGDDKDGDGLSNNQEFNGWQTEVNGLAEGYSYRRGFDLTDCGPDLEVVDTDGDGVSDYLEKLAGTNPRAADTDGDGMLDQWEIYVGLDPCDDGSVNPDNAPDQDPDGDGLSNLEEMSTVAPYARGGVATAANPLTTPTFGSGYFTWPLNYDSDGDRLIDSYEHRDTEHGLTADEYDDADADPDLDGLSTFREQCVHPLLARFWSGNNFPDSSLFTPSVSYSVVGYTDGYTREGLVGSGYMNKAEFNEEGDDAIAPGGVLWGSPLSTRRWLNPGNHDTDSDQLPDGWEIEHGLNALNGNLVENGVLAPSGPLGDPDNDGLYNYQEYFGADGYRIDFVTGTGDETDPWISRLINNQISNPFAQTVGQSTYGGSSFQSPMLYLSTDVYGSDFISAFNPTNLPGFFDPESYEAGDYVPIAGVPPAVELFDGADGTRTKFNPFSPNLGGIVFRDVGTLDGFFTPGVDDAWLDVNHTMTYVAADDFIIANNSGTLADGVVATSNIYGNIPTKWPMPGIDTDDDGLPDAIEIQADAAAGKIPSSPVQSLSPFIPRSAAVRINTGLSPANLAAGSEMRYFSRDFTVECWVFLTDQTTNDYKGAFIVGDVDLGGVIMREGYKLGVDQINSENSVPYVSFETLGGKEYRVAARRSLPKNRWVHVAGVFDHVENALSLYIDGLLEQSEQVIEESASTFGIDYGGTLTLAEDEGGAQSFANNLWIDEVRVWGAPRSSDEVADNRHHLIDAKQLSSEEKYGVSLLSPLFAYYTFDDGGYSAEDMTKPAKCSLMNNAYPSDTDVVIGLNMEYFYGDTAYAIDSVDNTTANTVTNFIFDANRPSPVIGFVDAERGALDSDKDGLPDAWEIVNEMNPFKVMTPDHVQLNAYDTQWGIADGPAPDAIRDLDGDGLNNLYEYWSRTNPRKADTDQDGRLDSAEDFDGDGLPNGVEVTLGSRPDLVDTDDDGYPDGEEQGLHTHLNNSLSPFKALALSFNGYPGSFLDIPQRAAMRLEDWTIEARILPAADSMLADGEGAYILRRVIQETEDGYLAANYELRVVREGSYLTPEARFISVDQDGNAQVFAVTGDPVNNGMHRIPVDEGSDLSGIFTHLAATFNYSTGELTLYMNGHIVAQETTINTRPPLSGEGPQSFLRVGQNYAGSVDDIRIWSDVRTDTEINDNLNTALTGAEPNLVSYFRIDDGGFAAHQAVGVVDGYQTDPPAAPVGGDRYLVGIPAGGDWSGHNGAIAVYDGSEWTFLAPDNAARAYNSTNGLYYDYSEDTTTWSPVSRILLSVLYDEAPATPVEGDSWWTNNIYCRFESGQKHEQVFTDKVFSEGVMLNDTPVDGDFAWWASRDEYYRYDMAQGNIWKRWGPGVSWLSEARIAVEEIVAAIASLPPSAPIGDVYFVEAGTDPAGFYISNGSGWTYYAVNDGDRVLDKTFNMVMDWESGASDFIEISGAIDGLYIYVLYDGVTLQADGTMWNRWGYTPTYEDFTVTDGWMSQWSQAAVPSGSAEPMYSSSLQQQSTDTTDSDGDGMPDWWEIQHGLDPNDATGVNGADGDPDGDNLTNLYEYWSNTDPHVMDTNDDGTSDYYEDYDVDGLSNGQEQDFRTRPDIQDTDDDGFTDRNEVLPLLSDPRDDTWPPRSPLYSMGAYSNVDLSFALTELPVGGGVVVPDNGGAPVSAMSAWTIESWFYSDNAAGQSGALIQKKTGSETAFELGVDAGYPYVKFSYQQGLTPVSKQIPESITDGYRIPDSTWTHLAATWNPMDRTLHLLIDGTLLYANTNDWSEQTWMPVNGTGQVVIGSAVTSWSGTTLMDNVRIWNISRTISAIDQTRLEYVAAGSDPSLVTCYRFDDAGDTIEDFAHPGNSLYVIDSAVYSIGYNAGRRAWLSEEARSFYGDDDADNDSIPDWWMDLFEQTEPYGDPDGDGLGNLYEYMAKTDPTRRYTEQSTGSEDGYLERLPVGLTLLQQQHFGTDPRYNDTDGDGINDDEEIKGSPERDEAVWPVSDPTTALQNDAGANDPQMIRRSITFDGTSRVLVTNEAWVGKYALADWTVEAWVRLDANTSMVDRTNIVIRRAVEEETGVDRLLNYELGVESSGGSFYPYVRYIGENVLGTASEVKVGGRAAPPLFGDISIDPGVWVHVAGTYESATNILKLYVNGMPVADNSRTSMNVLSPVAGRSHAEFTIGGGRDSGGIQDGFIGNIDQVRVWSGARDGSALFSTFRSADRNAVGGYDIGVDAIPGQATATQITMLPVTEALEIEHAPNQILLRFKPYVSAVQRAGLIQALGTETITQYDTLPLYLVEVTDGQDLTNKITAFRNSEAVLYAEPNYKLEAFRTPNDALFDQLWGLHNTGQTGGKDGADISAVSAWDKGIGNRDIIVAVIDTGVDYNHVDLAENMWINGDEIPDNGIDDDGNGYIDDYYGYDFANLDGNPMDGHGHGTHCSGTIGGVGNNGIGVAGVNWNVRIMALKFLTDGGWGWTADAVSAMEYAIKMGARISNNSWGGGGYSQALYDIIKQAGENNHIFVAAAGNWGMDNDILPHYPSSYDLPNIISVAATDDDDVLTYWSNYGAESVDLAAPGNSILSTLPNDTYGSMSGTSMACPHVAGVTALLLSMNPNMTYVAVKSALMNAVDPLDSLTGKMVSGGRLNANNALSGGGGLIAYFRCDSGGLNGVQDLTVYNDVLQSWRHNGTLEGNASFDSLFAQMTGDADGDGMPDWFETAYKVDDATADEDGDGLQNLYEYFAGTNPRQADTFNDGVTDGQRDSDNDTLINAVEQQAGSDAGLPDTDDDGMADNIEIENLNSPVISIFPTNDLVVEVDGSANPILLPNQPRLALGEDWTVEGWIRPSTMEVDGGVLIRRAVGQDGINYELGLRANGQGLYPYARIAEIGGDSAIVTNDGIVIPAEKWTHLAASYEKATSQLNLFVDGKRVAYRSGTAVLPAAEEAAAAQGVLGDGFMGMIDEVRVWSAALDEGAIYTNMYPALTGNEMLLAAYYRFDDNTSYNPPLIGTSGATNDLGRWSVGQIEDFVSTYAEDWKTDWFNAATIGSTSVTFHARAGLAASEEDSDGDGMADWWEYYYFGSLTASDGTEDHDGDGLLDLTEYQAGLNPMNQYTYGGAIRDDQLDSDNDGLSNIKEQNQSGTHPGKWDSDDDGVSDGEEVQYVTNPMQPMSVYSPVTNLHNMAAARSLDMGATAMGGIELPQPDRFTFVSNVGWTVEAWINPGLDGDGDIFAFEAIEGDSIVFSLTNGAPRAVLVNQMGEVAARVGGALTEFNGVGPLEQDQWTHIAVAWSPEDQSFRMYRDGVILAAQQTLYQMDVGRGRAFIARNFDNGYVDELRVWNRVRAVDEVADWFRKIYPAPGYVSVPYDGRIPALAGMIRYNQQFWSRAAYDQMMLSAYRATYEYGQPLVAYYRFDDGGEFIEDFAFMNDDRYHITGPYTTDEAYRTLGLDDADGDGLPEWWLDVHDLNLYADSDPSVYSVGPYHALAIMDGTDYPVSYASGWSTTDGTEGRNTRIYFNTQQEVDTNNNIIITYNVWKDIDPDPLPTNESPRETYRGKGVYNENTEWSDERIWWDVVWFTADETIGFNSGLFFNDKNGNEEYNGGEDIWIDTGSRYGIYDLQAVAGIWYYRTFITYNSVGGAHVAWWEDNRYITTKDTSVGYDGFYSAFTKYVYLNFEPTKAEMRLKLFQVMTNNLYVNGTRYEFVQDNDGYNTLDPDYATLLGLLRRGRNSVYLYTQNGTNAVLHENNVNYDADYSRSMTAMKFDCSLTVNNVDVIKRGDDTVVDPRSVWHGAAWSTYYNQEVGSVKPHPDLALVGQLNDDYGIPLDPDNDGLDAYYEFRINTNPRDLDTDDNAIYDGDEDYDGDGLKNIREQELGADPRLVDTDDDDISDFHEVEHGTDPVDSLSPFLERVLELNGADDSYVKMPNDPRFALRSWSLAAWVRPNAISNHSEIIAREIESDLYNFYMGWDLDGCCTIRPVIKFTSYPGQEEIKLMVTNDIPTNSWTHFAGTFDATTGVLCLYLDGDLKRSITTAGTPLFNSVGPIAGRVGRHFNGKLDDALIVDRALSDIEVLSIAAGGVVEGTDGLVSYYRFDDRSNTNGTSGYTPWDSGQVQDFSGPYEADWLNAWVNAGTLNSTSGIAYTRKAAGVLYVTSPNPDGIYYPGETVTVWVAFSEPVYTVLGTPTIQLELDATNRFADYTASFALPSRTLAFNYVVEDYDWTWDLAYSASNALAGGGILDGHMYALDTYLPTPGDYGSLSWNKNLVIAYEYMFRHGMSASWLLANFGTTMVDPNADPDGDGMSNLEEFWAVTQPNNAASYFHVAAVQSVPGGFSIGWDAASNRYYTVEFVEGLVNPNWDMLNSFTNMPYTNSWMTVIDTAVPSQPRFYRVIVTVPDCVE